MKRFKSYTDCRYEGASLVLICTAVLLAIVLAFALAELVAPAHGIIEAM